MLSRGAELLKAVRGSQEMKARRLGLSQTYVSMLERGERGASANIRELCAKHYGIPAEAWDQAGERQEAQAQALEVAHKAEVVPAGVDPDIYQKIANLLTKAGEWKGRATVLRLSATFGVSPDVVRELITDVALSVAADRGSVAVNREASVSYHRAIANKAFENQDFKNALAALAVLDDLTGVRAKSKSADNGDGELRSALAIILEELKSHWPEAAVACLQRLRAAKEQAGAIRAA